MCGEWQCLHGRESWVSSIMGMLCCVEAVVLFWLNRGWGELRFLSWSTCGICEKTGSVIILIFSEDFVEFIA